MNLHHLSDRRQAEGTIDDVFARIDGSRPEYLSVVQVINQLRTHVVGPDVWCYEGHQQLTFVPEDKPVDILLRLIATDTCYKVVYEQEFQRHWSATISVRGSNTVQSALIIVNVLGLVGRALGDFRYVNDNPAASARRKGTMLRCPHCGITFDMTDTLAWNADERHLLCGQRIAI